MQSYTHGSRIVINAWFKNAVIHARFKNAVTRKVKECSHTCKNIVIHARFKKAVIHARFKNVVIHAQFTHAVIHARSKNTVIHARFPQNAKNLTAWLSAFMLRLSSTELLIYKKVFLIINRTTDNENTSSNLLWAGRERIYFLFPLGERIFCTLFGLALGSTDVSIRIATWTFSTKAKRFVHETHCSPPSSSDVKISCAFMPWSLIT
jgi:hypothetical protein